MITYLLPTRDRPDALRRTLDALDRLDAHAHDAVGGAEIIVVDNASHEPVEIADDGRIDLSRRVIRLEENLGAAARNIGAQEAQGEWIIMLDDDSYPLDCGHIDVIMNAPQDLAAIGAEILLPNGVHEAGGLPEVIIGCGAAIRRDAFLAVGGYDASFDYYAEEYDLCARFILNGWRVEHDFRFRVRHEKAMGGRDMNRILHRLVRNNCWVMQRYAPAAVRSAQILQTIQRYAEIAMKECAASGFARGMADALETLDSQPDRSMSHDLFDRFTGAAHARAALLGNPAISKGASVALVCPGKNLNVITQILNEIAARICDAAQAEALVVGTLSPGPSVDALVDHVAETRPVIAPSLPLWLQNARPFNHDDELVAAGRACNNC